MDQESDEERTEVAARQPAARADPAYERLSPLGGSLIEEETTTSTPKLHDLSGMLRQAQRERLGEIASRGLQVTLPTGQRPEDLRQVISEYQAKLEAREHPGKDEVTATQGMTWRRLVVAMVVGATLFGAGLLAGGWLATLSGARSVHLVWDVASSGATLRIDGIEQPATGTGTFPCTGGYVAVTVQEPGKSLESHRVACGADLLLRIRGDVAPGGRER